MRCHRHGVLDLFGGGVAGVGTSGAEGQPTGEGQSGEPGAIGAGDILATGDDINDDPTAHFRKGAPPADSHLQYISIFSRRFVIIISETLAL